MCVSVPRRDPRPAGELRLLLSFRRPSSVCRLAVVQDVWLQAWMGAPIIPALPGRPGCGRESRRAEVAAELAALRGRLLPPLRDRWVLHVRLAATLAIVLKPASWCVHSRRSWAFARAKLLRDT
mmetsp:Transcript_77541/g.244975  ORF Transcript_77541/g.244975 Transcript_77541/m.244975 type:complete len:124 (+) Transcript_77541:266-637(+)